MICTGATNTLTRKKGKKKEKIISVHQLLLLCTWIPSAAAAS
jgi:hypothetical protein